MKDILSSKWLKAICYIVAPILIAVIILNIFSLTYYANYEEDINGTVNYFQTERFANDYLNTVYRAVYNISNNRTTSLITEQTENTTVTDQNTYEVKEKSLNIQNEINYNLNRYVTTYAYDMIIILNDGTIFTNISKTLETDTLDELKKYVLNRPYQWIYDGKEVKTDIEKLKYNKIAYNSQFEGMKETGFQIYTCLKDENLPQMYRYNLIYETVSRTYWNAPIVSTICSLLLLAVAVYLLLSIGHKKGQEGIYTDGLEEIPLEIVGISSSILVSIEAYFISIFSSMAYNIDTSYMINTGISLDILMAIIMYITIVITGITIVRRLKAHIFWKSTLCYKLFKFLTKTTNHLTGELFKNFSATVKLAVIFGGSILISLILILLAKDNFFFGLVLIAFWYYIYKKLLNYANSISKIKEKIEKMYNGNIVEPLNEEEFSGKFKEIAIQLNDISGGLSNAIEEAMKSERLKTELITNVSHDIKTPLTSIINYVDLMKKEEIDNEKVQEYLQVLENKSQRLKKLTEDLLEASKVSSGNIKLTMEKLDVKELIKQVGGEFEDKFNKKGLQIIESFPEELVYINADSRYMYRILENMYINIAKYALENSRVYVDTNKKDGKIQIVLKNISQDKLNISVDELMQRFVRGDSSRTTQGSGLGISIAKSLTELQQGEFDIYLDGDLFKVVIGFKAI